METNVVTVLFIVDTSGSMYGQKIGSVNAAMAECIESVRQLKQWHNYVCRVEFATFDENMKEPVMMEDLNYSAIPYFEVEAKWNGFYSLTSFYGLYRGIQTYLEKGQGQTGQLYIFLITDGKPADRGTYMERLERVKSMERFRKAKRYVVLVGNEKITTDNDILEFVEFQANKVIGLVDLSSEILKIADIMDIHTYRIFRD